MKAVSVRKTVTEFLGFAVVAAIVGIISLMYYVHPGGWSGGGNDQLGQPT